MESVEWRNIATGLEISYMITGGVRADIKFINSLVEGEESWTAPHLYGKTNTFSGGLVGGSRIGLAVLRSEVMSEV